jgi:hypothetical protein
VSVADYAEGEFFFVFAGSGDCKIAGIASAQRFRTVWEDMQRKDAATALILNRCRTATVIEIPNR